MHETGVALVFELFLLVRTASACFVWCVTFSGYAEGLLLNGVCILSSGYAEGFSSIKFQGKLFIYYSNLTVGVLV